MPWTGKSARYTLKIHLAKHREALNDLMQVSQNIAYVVPNPQMRVRAFLTSLQSTDRNIIQSEPRYLNDFEQIAEYILRVCPEKGHLNTRKMNISALNSEPVDQKLDGLNDFEKKAHKNKSVVPLYYLSKRTYEKLTKTQRKELHDWRISNGQGDGNTVGSSKKSRGQKKCARISALTTQVEELKQSIAALTKGNTVGIGGSGNENSATGNKSKLKRPSTSGK